MMSLLKSRPSGRGSGSRHFHAERKTQLVQDLLDLLQRLLAEVLRLQHVLLGPPDEVAQGVDVGVLERVGRADREVELVDVLGQQGVEPGQLLAAQLAAVVPQALLGLDENAEVVLEQHSRQRNRLLGGDGPVGPHLEDQALVVGRLAEARGLDAVVDAPDRAVRRVQRDPADAHRFIKVAVGRDVAASLPQLRLQLEVTLLVEGGHVDLLVVDLDLRILGHLAGGDAARPLHVDREHLGLVRVQTERDLFEIEDDVRNIFLHAWDRGELMEHPLDVDRRNGRPLDRGQQTAPQGVADRRGKATFERLGGEAAIDRGQALLIDLEALRALETFPKHGETPSLGWPLGLCGSAAVELDDQLLLDRELDVLARWQAQHPAAHVLGIKLEPLRDATAPRGLDARPDHRVLTAALLDHDGLVGLDLVRGDADLAAVHQHVAVADELPRLGPRSREAEAVDDVVEPPLQHHQEVLAGDALAAVGLLEIVAELALEHAIDALDLLLLAELQAVAQRPTAAPRAVLARREVAPLDRALLFEAAVTLEKQLHPLPAAEPADGSRISGHLYSP